MKYLFLDDERMPKDVTWLLIGGVGSWGADWQIVRSCDEAIKWVRDNGFPDVISFDHDLGLMHYANDYSDGKTGYDFAKWLVEYFYIKNPNWKYKSRDVKQGSSFRFPKVFTHSANPIGSANIMGYINNFLMNEVQSQTCVRVQIQHTI